MTRQVFGGVFYQGDGLTGLTAPPRGRLGQWGPEPKGHIRLSAGPEVGSETSTPTTAGSIRRLQNSCSLPMGMDTDSLLWLRRAWQHVPAILLKSAEFCYQPNSRCWHIRTSFSVGAYSRWNSYKSRLNRTSRTKIMFRIMAWL